MRERWMGRRESVNSGSGVPWGCLVSTQEVSSYAPPAFSLPHSRRYNLPTMGVKIWSGDTLGLPLVSYGEEDLLCLLAVYIG